MMPDSNALVLVGAQHTHGGAENNDPLFSHCVTTGCDSESGHVCAAAHINTHLQGGGDPGIQTSNDAGIQRSRDPMVQGSYDL